MAFFEQWFHGLVIVVLLLDVRLDADYLTLVLCDDRLHILVHLLHLLHPTRSRRLVVSLRDAPLAQTSLDGLDLSGRSWRLGLLLLVYWPFVAAVRRL